MFRFRAVRVALLHANRTALRPALACASIIQHRTIAEDRYRPPIRKASRNVLLENAADPAHTYNVTKARRRSPFYVQPEFEDGSSTPWAPGIVDGATNKELVMTQASYNLLWNSLEEVKTVLLPQAKERYEGLLAVEKQLYGDAGGIHPTGNDRANYDAVPDTLQQYVLPTEKEQRAARLLAFDYMQYVELHGKELNAQVLQAVVDDVSEFDPAADPLLTWRRPRMCALVTLVHVNSGESNVYQLVGEHEHNPDLGLLSITSPLGNQIINCEQGDLLLVPKEHVLTANPKDRETAKGDLIMDDYEQYMVVGVEYPVQKRFESADPQQWYPERASGILEAALLSAQADEAKKTADRQKLVEAAKSRAEQRAREKSAEYVRKHFERQESERLLFRRKSPADGGSDVDAGSGESVGDAEAVYDDIETFNAQRIDRSRQRMLERLRKKPQSREEAALMDEDMDAVIDAQVAASADESTQAVHVPLISQVARYIAEEPEETEEEHRKRADEAFAARYFAPDQVEDAVNEYFEVEEFPPVNDGTAQAKSAESTGDSVVPADAGNDDHDGEDGVVDDTAAGDDRDRRE